MKEVKKAYQKKPSIKDILSKKEWDIKDTQYNDKTGKYDIKAIHEDGREVFISRNRQYVDNLINELLDEKRRREQG